MNLPLIFQSFYLSPLMLETGAMRAIHEVLYPRITGQVSGGMGDIMQAAARPNKPTGYHRRAVMAAPGRDAMGGIDPRYYFSVEGRPEVAVIPINGIIAKGASFIEEACDNMVNPDRVAHATAQVKAESSIKTVVYDIGSPGGSTLFIPELASMVRDLAQTRGKTVYAFTDTVMASAAIYIGSQANEIITSMSARVGSIGTILALQDESVKLAQSGVKTHIFAEGKHKGIGLPGRELSAEDMAYLQDGVKKLNDGFTSAVKSARPHVKPEALTHAKTYWGASAVAVGLSDGLVTSWDEFVSLI